MISLRKIPILYNKWKIACPFLQTWEHPHPLRLQSFTCCCISAISCIFRQLSWSTPRGPNCNATVILSQHGRVCCIRTMSHCCTDWLNIPLMNHGMGIWRQLRSNQRQEPSTVVRKWNKVWAHCVKNKTKEEHFCCVMLSNRLNRKQRLSWMIHFKGASLVWCTPACFNF